MGIYRPQINMWVFLRLCFVLTITLAAITRAQEYKVCAKHGLSNACQQIGRSGELSCEINLHSVDCLLNIESGKSSLGLVSAEEAFLAAPLTSNIQVIGEKHSENSVPFESVVIVKSDYESGFANLKNKKYCHPGFKYQEIVSPLILQEFELKALESSNTDICNYNGTLVEKHVRGISEFFESACRPGPWTIDDALDKELKSKYSSLCSLCDSNSCNSTPNDPFQAVLTCLTTKSADIAFTLLDKAKEFFNNTDNAQNYRYLCPDGIASAPDLPCSWTTQIRSLLVTNKENANNVKSLAEKWLVDYTLINAEPYSSSDSRGLSGSQFAEQLVEVLNINKRKDKINFTEPTDLQEYVKARRSVPTSTSAKKCGTSVTWCTTSEQEKTKCNWLAQASVGRGLQPVVECIQRETEQTCIDDISQSNADVATFDANYTYAARKKKLLPLAYPETEVRDLRTILAVVNVNDTEISRFENLRDKSLCLPEYGGLEFVAFIDAGRERKVLNKNVCNYDKLLSEFVGDSCVPGTFQQESFEGEKEKLCRKCTNSAIATTHENCNSDSTNKYYGNEGALWCLSQIGDFAVITQQTSYSIETNQFRVLCRNGSLAGYNGLDVDRDCALTVVINSEVSSSVSNKKNDDIKLLLQEYEKWYGVDSKKPFELFNEFNGTKDLLFKDSTPGLEFSDNNNGYIKNYTNLFSQIDQCVISGATNIPLYVAVLISSLFVYFM